jgi:AcrR family transcriptional regulator
VTASAAPRWRRRPLERRDELLDAAQRCFTRAGLARTSVADIAAEAGVAKGSVYTYFETKDELVSALKDRFFDRMLRRVSEVTAAMPDAGFAELADAATDATTRLLFAEADLVELWCRETVARPGDEFSRGMNRLVDLYADALTDAAASGTVDCADPRTTAHLLVYAVEGTATHAILNGTGPTPDEVVAATQDLTRRTLGLPPRP